MILKIKNSCRKTDRLTEQIFVYKTTTDKAIEEQNRAEDAHAEIIDEIDRGKRATNLNYLECCDKQTGY